MSAQNFTLNKTHAKLKSLGYRTDKMLISDFMSLCEDCYSLFKVELYSESVAKRATNPKKLYCVDNGLPTLTGRAFSDNRGRLLENAVFVSLRRKGIPIHYYRSRSGFEIDFLIMDQNENLMLIQVCDSLENEEARNRELRAFVEAGKELKSKFQIIITSNETDLIRLGRQKIQIMPIWDFFLKLEAEAPPFRLTTHP